MFSQLQMVDIQEYKESPIDEISANSRDLLTLFNTKKYLDILPRLCLEYTNEKVKEPILYHIDRYGFNLLAVSKVCIQNYSKNLNC